MNLTQLMNLDQVDLMLLGWIRDLVLIQLLEMMKFLYFNLDPMLNAIEHTVLQNAPVRKRQLSSKRILRHL